MIKHLRLFLSDKLFDVALKVCDLADWLAPASDEGWRSRMWNTYERRAEEALTEDQWKCPDCGEVWPNESECLNCGDLDEHFDSVPHEPVRLGDSLDLSAYTISDDEPMLSWKDGEK